MFSRMLWRSLAARRARLGLGLVAVSLGVAVATTLATLALGVGDDLARTLRASGPNFVVQSAGASWPLDLGGATFEPTRAGLALPETSVAALKHGFWKHNVLDAAPELVLPVEIANTPATLTGTWFERSLAIEGERWRTGLHRLHPHWGLEGRWPREGAAELALGRDLAARLQLVPGGSAEVAHGDRRERWRVTAIVSAGGFDDRIAWAPLADAQRLAGRPGVVDRVWLSALVKPSPRGPAPDPERDPHGYERYLCTAYPANIARDLAERLPGASVLPMSEVVAGEGRVVERLNLLMLLLGLAALTASTLGLLSTTTAIVVERRIELGLLRAIGASSRQLALLLLGETLLVSLAGGALGWALGSLAAGAIRGGTFGSASVVQPLLLPVALLLSLLVATLGTLGPLRVALRLEPAGVLRGQV